MTTECTLRWAHRVLRRRCAPFPSRIYMQGPSIASKSTKKKTKVVPSYRARFTCSKVHKRKRHATPRHATQRTYRPHLTHLSTYLKPPIPSRILPRRRRQRPNIDRALTPETPGPSQTAAAVDEPREPLAHAPVVVRDLAPRQVVDQVFRRRRC